MPTPKGRLVALVLALLGLSSCGYAFRTSDNSALEKEGVLRVYIAPMSNNTYRAGVENLIYNSLLRSLSSQRGVKLVRTENEADGVLHGLITRADFYSSAWKNVAQINAPPKATANFQNANVSTEYTAYLSCSFYLNRRVFPPGTNPRVWGATFDRSRPFPASNQLGVYGTTSSLINDSEFDRTLTDLAQSMMADVQESLLSRF